MEPLFFTDYKSLYKKLFSYKDQLVNISSSRLSLENALIELSELIIKTDLFLGSFSKNQINLNLEAAVWFLKAEIYAAGLIKAKNEGDDEVVINNYRQIMLCMDYADEIYEDLDQRGETKDIGFIAQFNSYGYSETEEVKNLLENTIVPYFSLENKCSGAAASSP